MIQSSKARQIILDACPQLGTESSDLASALGRIVAKDVVAHEDIPAGDNSGMDGYAVRSDDTSSPNGQVVLNLVGEVRAGAVYRDEVRAGESVKIMTGAPIPRGTDAVVEREQVEESDGRVTLKIPVLRGRHIRKRGEDIQAGKLVLEKGRRLRPYEMGVLASLGIEKISVHRRPEVALLTTGDELTPVGNDPAPGQVRDSNAVTLAAQIFECGGKVISLDPCGDDEVRLEEALRRGLSSDALISTGGVSVGDYDLVLRVLERIGVRIQFWGLNIKPGKPFAFGLHLQADRVVPVFALPGNPVSAAVTFLQFVRPGLMKMQGATPRETLSLYARLEGKIHKADGKRHFLRGIVGNESGQLVVRLTDTQSSGALTSLLQANCFIIVPEETREIKHGDLAEIELL